MSLWILSLVLTMGLVNAVEPDCTKTPISNCPLYNFQSDKVTPQDFQNKNVFGEHWLMIYYSQFKLISADLRNNSNMDFSDTRMEFSWKGLDCGFDGVIKTTNGAETWRTSLAWIFIVTVTSLFL